MFENSCVPIESIHLFLFSPQRAPGGSSGCIVPQAEPPSRVETRCKGGVPTQSTEAYWREGVTIHELWLHRLLNLMEGPHASLKLVTFSNQAVVKGNHVSQIRQGDPFPKQQRLS